MQLWKYLWNKDDICKICRADKTVLKWRSKAYDEEDNACGIWNTWYLNKLWYLDLQGELEIELRGLWGKMRVSGKGLHTGVFEYKSGCESWCLTN